MNNNIEEVVTSWQNYLRGVNDWESLVIGAAPKQTDCGPIYELINPIDRPNESFAVCDMRGLGLTGAHYHTNGETEIYFFLAGTGTVLVGGKPIEVSKGSVVVTPPDTSHFALSRGLALAVVNTPPFSADNYRALKESKPEVGFDVDQYSHYKEIHGKVH